MPEQSTPEGFGPLAGVRVVELAGLGPGPHAGMMLADLGADVVRVERPGAATERGAPRSPDLVLRGRRVIGIDLRSPEGREHLLTLVSHADVFIEGNLPGTAERLGIGPDDCLERNPRLIYGRVTGWGQEGPMAHDPGHDLNFLAATGVLWSIGHRDETPPPPLNLLGASAGGSMFLVTGILAALFERETSGIGQVIDSAIVDGLSALSQRVHAMRHSGDWVDDRESNASDGGRPWYRTYRCADGEFVAVAAIERKYYDVLVTVLGLDPMEIPPRRDASAWPELQRVLTDAFATAPRDEWAERFREHPACVTPVLSWAEAQRSEHLVARGTFAALDGMVQAAPAPRFSRTRTRTPGAETHGHRTDAVSEEWAKFDRRSG
ncbi:CaiB/BaiF CoA-transferase family protein [Salinibacterium sp. ZJ450]|uniref:CaiB/BaiF CoA transferase family protein n=1 Tax=Salinibacterium sp. ZJ450 TaxID=2708338 RepID=UPI00142069DC|nr:CaiB/BaiF CoA-transferase family protein [Salinibacterium sp. ZJ450]